MLRIVRRRSERWNQVKEVPRLSEDERPNDPFASDRSLSRAPVGRPAEQEASLLLKQLEEVRVKKKMSKADVSRSVGKNPAAIRRLLTSESFNPELQTLLELAESLGLKVELVKQRRPYRRRMADEQGVS